MNDRESNGRFAAGNKAATGRKNAPRELHELFKSAGVSAVNRIIEIMNDDNEKPELRLKCAFFIIEKGFGKSLECLQVDEASPATDWGF